MFYEILTIAIAGFLSGIIKTGVGVGAGIFLLPTLCLVFPAKLALGIGAPLMLASDILGLKFYWKQWLPHPALTKLMISVIPGLILGIILLPMIPGDVFRVCIGIFGTLYALNMLWKTGPLANFIRGIFGGLKERYQDKSSYFFGFLGGVATVLAHAGGIVWSLFLLDAAQNRRIFVGTTIILFFITNLYKVISYIFIDILSVNDLMMILPAIPMVFVGSWIGNIINKRFKSDIFRKIVLCIIMFLSISLCL